MAARKSTRVNRPNNSHAPVYFVAAHLPGGKRLALIHSARSMSRSNALSLRNSSVVLPSGVVPLITDANTVHFEMIRLSLGSRIEERNDVAGFRVDRRYVASLPPIAQGA